MEEANRGEPPLKWQRVWRHDFTLSPNIQISLFPVISFEKRQPGWPECYRVTPGMKCMLFPSPFRPCSPLLIPSSFLSLSTGDVFGFLQFSAFERSVHFCHRLWKKITIIKIYFWNIYRCLAWASPAIWNHTILFFVFVFSFLIEEASLLEAKQTVWPYALTDSPAHFSLPLLSYQPVLELRVQVIPILALTETLPSSMCTN